MVVNKHDGRIYQNKQRKYTTHLKRILQHKNYKFYINCVMWHVLVATINQFFTYMVENCDFP
jgi:hypothetical protein